MFHPAGGENSGGSFAGSFVRNGITKPALTKNPRTSELFARGVLPSCPLGRHGTEIDLGQRRNVLPEHPLWP